MREKQRIENVMDEIAKVAMEEELKQVLCVCLCVCLSICSLYTCAVCLSLQMQE
jgi:hypothetical protein